jgi:nitrite reductase/ring-hydroxylating ferredoxin subunit
MHGCDPWYTLPPHSDNEDQMQKSIECKLFRIFFKTHTGFATESCYERRSLLTFEQSLKDGSPFFNKSRET